MNFPTTSAEGEECLPRAVLILAQRLTFSPITHALYILVTSHQQYLPRANGMLRWSTMSFHTPDPAPTPATVSSPISELRAEVNLEVVEHLIDGGNMSKQDPKPDLTADARRNLTNLCLVSKEWRIFASHILYRSVEIADLHTLSLFVRTINTRPELGKRVRSLFLSPKICSGCGPEFAIDVGQRLHSVLAVTTNLRLLYLNLEECRTCWYNSNPTTFHYAGTDGE